MKNIMLVLVLVVSSLTLGCVEAYADDTVVFPSGDAQYGCVIVSDSYGEREMCGVNYYVVNGGVVYFDPAFNLWIFPHGYWYGGIYHNGFWNGYYAHYGAYYHPYGWHASHGWHGGYNGGWHGGSYHGGGGYHGGGWHGGGSHGGGHGGHH